MAEELPDPLAAALPEATPSLEGVAARSAEPPSVVPVPEVAPEVAPDVAPEVAPEPVSGRLHAVFWLAIGCVVVGIAQVPMALLARRLPAAAPSAPSTASSSSASTPIVASAMPPPPPPPSTMPPLIEPDAGPPPFRIAQLESDIVEVAHAKVGKRTCVQTLAALSVSSIDAARVATAIAPHRKLDGCHANDRIFVAIGKIDRRLRALELETAPGKMLRVVEKTPSNGAPGTSELVAEAVDLPVTHKRHATAFVVTSDVSSALVAAGLDPTLIEPLDEALSTRTDVPAPSKGSVFRVVADATYVAGRFDRYDELVAFEYRPREGVVLRLYHLREATHGKNHGWFDGKGHQPIHAKWRMPLAFPRITSRFNPRRKHPVLKVIMPHNGCDFAAPTGTPVYSIGAGVVVFRGDAGPSGNLITIAHDGGIESGYAHLSRYAAGVVVGTHVEAHTLIGYVGSTGRSTGPHLHLSVKRHGVFIDPLALKMDAFRVVPPSERTGFGARKADADAALDAIPLPKVDSTPAPPPTAPPAAEVEEIADEHPH